MKSTRLYGEIPKTVEILKKEYNITVSRRTVIRVLDLVTDSKHRDSIISANTKAKKHIIEIRANAPRVIEYTQNGDRLATKNNS